MAKAFYTRTEEISDRFADAKDGGTPLTIEPLDEQKMKPMRLSGNMDCFSADVWCGWTNQGIRALENQLCTVHDAQGRLNIILRGTNNKFWQSASCSNMLWGDWYTPGNISFKQNADMTSRFFASRFGKDGRVVLFVLGADGNIWDYWTAFEGMGCEPWVFRRLPICAEPGFFAIERHYGGLEAFAIGLDNSIWHSWTKDYDNDEWSNWESLNGWANSGLYLYNNAEKYPELFVLDPENAVWTIRHCKNGWRNWTRLGNAMRGHCACAPNGEDGLYLYGVGCDRKLYRISRAELNGEWGQWQCLGGLFGRLVGSAIDGEGEAKVALIGADHRLWVLKEDDTFEDMGGNLGFASINTNQSGQVVVFGCGHDGNLFCRKV